MGSMDAPGYNAGRRRVTADPPIAPGRACYKPRRVRAGSSPLVIAHMAVESARLVPGMKSLQLCQLQASENGPDTTERAPLDARGWVPSVFRARPANEKKVGAPCRRHPEKKDRLTCARGPQPKGRKDATREGQDGGSRRRRDNWTTASDGTYPARLIASVLRGASCAF